MIRLAVALLLASPLAMLPARGAETAKLRPVLAIHADGEGRGMVEPRGVACDAQSVVVADTANGRILLYDVAQGVVSYRAQIAAPQVPVPLALGLLPDGDLLALDGRSRRLARLTRTGEFRGYLEPQGIDPGSFTPYGLAVGRDGRIHVLDIRGARVLVLDPSGAALRSIAFATDARFPSGVAVGGRGDVYVVDSVARRVDVARAGDAVFSHLTPSLAEDVDFPTAIVVDDEDRLLVLDENGGGVVILARDGSFRGRPLGMGWKEGFLRYPVAACVGARGELFIAERGSNRVQMFLIR